MELRPYQKQAIQKTLEAIQQKKSNKLVWVMATGTGKTVAFADLAAQIIATTNKKVLILAHREELLDQAQNKVLQTDPTLNVSIEQAENISDHLNGNVIIASIPTLGRQGSSRLLKFDPKDFGLIIVDEAHHASAKSYVNVLRHFGVLKPREKDEEKDQEEILDADWNKDCLLLGVTATPSRADNKGIDAVFDEVVFEYDIIKAIKEGYLSPIRAIRVKTATDISHIKKTAGDFNIHDLEEAVNTKDRNELIVKAYKEMIPGKQAILFAVDIKHALDIVETFIAGEVNTSFVFGSTDKESRVQRLQAFNDKKINVMVNVGVLTEGVDIPSVDAVLMARPTASGILYSQMLGRGTRLYPGKDHLMVIDFVDTTKKAKLQTVGSLLGRPDAIDFKGKDILGVQQELEDLLAAAPNIDLENIDIDRIKELIEKVKFDYEAVDLLGSLRVASPLAEYSKYKWKKYNEDEYRIVGPTDKDTKVRLTFSITETITEKFIVKRKAFDTGALRWLDELEIGSFPTLQEAVGQADHFIAMHHNELISIFDSNARWLRSKPSEKQINFIRVLRSQGKLDPQKYTDDVLKEMTKGDASEAIGRGKMNKPGYWQKNQQGKLL